MNNLIFGLKREYWECKKQLVMVPIIVTGLFFLMAFVATWTQQGADSALLDLGVAGENGRLRNSAGNGDDFWFTGVYLAAAWLSAMFYTLTSLFNDRQDKSILYWKTMPVSELQTVMSKLVFAIFGFSIIAILISWLSAAVLMAYAQLVFPPEMLATDGAGLSFSKLVVWPIFTVVIALFWCAPVFSLLLYVSARAKRAPILMLLVSVVVVRIVEKIVFSSTRIFDFLYAHSPFGLLGKISRIDSAGDLVDTFLLNSFPSLLVGLLIAGLLIWRTVWRRDNDFEV
jgi:ABC-2 type transport system permease protein